jgi:serine protease Do
MNRIELVLAALGVVGSAAFAQPVPPAAPIPPTPPAAAPAPRARRVAEFSAPASYLGVGVADIDGERMKALNLKEERGAEVKAVDEDSPAAKAGIKVGDVILEYNGQRVEGMEQFVRMVGETPVGRQVRLGVSRGGASQTLTATVAERPGHGRIFNDKDLSRLQEQISKFRMPDIPRPVISLQSHQLGVEAEPLSSQLAEYFGVKEGVLVRSVNKGSAAEKAGLKAGDVITKVGAQKVVQPADVSRALKSMTPGKGFPIQIMRERKETTVTASIEENSSERLALTPVRWYL